jgi:hypothetical protein
MSVKRVGIDHLPGDQRLRGGHQLRIGRDLRGIACPLVLGIIPIARECSAATALAQQCHRIGEIGIKCAVMRDHRGDAAIAEQRRTILAKHPATVVERLDQAERCCSLEQSLGPVLRQARDRRELIERHGATGQRFQQAGFDAGCQYL